MKKLLLAMALISAANANAVDDIWYEANTSRTKCHRLNRIYGNKFINTPEQYEQMVKTMNLPMHLEKVTEYWAVIQPNDRNDDRGIVLGKGMEKCINALQLSEQNDRRNNFLRRTGQSTMFSDR